MIHGTTLVTNAIIERKGARTALLATRRLPRRARDRPRAPLRALRPRARAAASRSCRATCASTCRSGRWPTAPTLAGARRGVRRAAGRASWRTPASRRSRSRSCTATRTRPTRSARARRRAARRAGDARLDLVRGGAGDPRVRAHLDHDRERLRPGPHRGVPARAGGAGWRALGFAGALPPDAVGGRHRDAGDGDALPGPAARVGPGGGRARRRAPTAPRPASPTCSRSTWAARPPSSR